MRRQIENNIYSSIKMRKGHRRTQSDTIHVSQKNIQQPTPPPNQALSHQQITKLLNICNEKVKQKVSNVEVLCQPSNNGYLYFKFGQSSQKKLVQLRQNGWGGDALACIPEKKQSVYQDCEENHCYLVNNLQFEGKKIDKKFQQKFRRLPFTDALNATPRQRRKAGPEKTKVAQQSRNKLGLKLKF